MSGEVETFKHAVRRAEEDEVELVFLEEVSGDEVAFAKSVVFSENVLFVVVFLDEKLGLRGDVRVVATEFDIAAVVKRNVKVRVAGGGSARTGGDSCGSVRVWLGAGGARGGGARRGGGSIVGSGSELHTSDNLVGFVEGGGSGVRVIEDWGDVHEHDSNNDDELATSDEASATEEASVLGLAKLC